MAAAVVGIAYPFLFSPGRTAAPVALATAGVVVIVAASVYAVAGGQPGLHGERLFVAGLFKEQADLCGLATSPPTAPPASTPDL